MRNIQIIIAYDGTRYSGWQVQKNAVTVQAEVQKALREVTGRRTSVIGASRTDAGVHARRQAANFRTDCAIPVENVPPAVSRLLPEDIVVLEAAEVPDGFNSRFDAKSKLYRYRIYRSPARDPFRERYSWRVSFPLDVDIMRREASALIGEHDFRSFQASDKHERSSVRRITRLDITERNDELFLDIEGNGFLYNMVRSITGTLVDGGRGYLQPGSMEHIISARRREAAGPTAPAKGLFLQKVRY
jgi:tRNA pseudouridine38-40 synthase